MNQVRGEDAEREVSANNYVMAELSSRMKWSTVGFFSRAGATRLTA
jgi:hypothetical protein